MTATTPDTGNAFAKAIRRPTFLDRLPAARERLRHPDALLSAASSVLLPLGLLLIVLGWWGAAHTPYLFEQVPYLISGGLLGAALVAGAGLCYFGSWIAKSAQQQREAATELADLLREVRDELAARPVVTVEPTPRRRSSKVASRAQVVDGGGGLVATAGGSMIHRPDCSVVVGRTDVRAIGADDGGGLRPCRLCSPLAAQIPAIDSPALKSPAAKSHGARA